jgi:uncharacterized cupredoxin-like copper-binding protein
MKPLILLFLTLLTSPTISTADIEIDFENVNCDLQRAANWENATPLVITLRDFDIKPEKIRLRACTPYAMTIKNVGKRHHDFISESFFQNIYVRNRTTGEHMRLAPEIHGTEVMPGEEQSLTFFVSAVGTFKYVCTHFGHSTLGMKGKIKVEE